MELAVGLLLLEELGERRLHETAGRSDDREDPHPEDGSGTSDDDGACHSGDVTYTDTGSETDAERFERRYCVAVLPLLRSGQGELGRPVDLQDRNAFQPDHEIDTETDEEHERYIPHVRVDGPDNARKINHYIKSYATSKSQSEPR